MDDPGPSTQERRSTRKRVVSQGMAVVDEATRRRAAMARLDALESDNAGLDAQEDEDDSEYVAEEEEDGALGQPQKKTPGAVKRKKTRASGRLGANAGQKGAVKPFPQLLAEANLQALPAHVPTYLTAAMGPPKATSVRKFCSICGFTAPYTCTRCGARFCCGRCQSVHADTRCLKFLA
eukprot:jgi/Mesvir1/4504/Mv03783-RA.1